MRTRGTFLPLILPSVEQAQLLPGQRQSPPPPCSGLAVPCTTARLAQGPVTSGGWLREQKRAGTRAGATEAGEGTGRGALAGGGSCLWRLATRMGVRGKRAAPWVTAAAESAGR